MAGMKACAGTLQWMAMLMWFEASRGDVVASLRANRGAEEKNV